MENLMDTNFQWTTTNIMLIFALWLFLGISSVLIHAILAELKRVFSDILTIITNILDVFSYNVNRYSVKDGELSELKNLLIHFFYNLSAIFRNTIDSILSVFDPSVAEIAAFINRRGDLKNFDFLSELSIEHFRTEQRKNHLIVKYQKIFGAAIELVFLVLVMQAVASESSRLFMSLDSNYQIPVFLTSSFSPSLIAAIVPIIAMGMYMGDILGLTYFTNLTTIKGRAKKVFLSMVVITIFFSLIVLILWLLSSTGIIYSTEKGITVLQTLFYIPLVTTLFFLAGGLRGLLIVIAAVILIFQILSEIASLFFRIFFSMNTIGFSLAKISLSVSAKAIAVAFQISKQLIVIIFFLLSGSFVIVTFPVSILFDIIIHKLFGYSSKMFFLPLLSMIGSKLDEDERI